MEELLLVIVLRLLFLVPLGAIFLRVAVKLLMKFDAPFGQACLAVFVVLVASESMGFLFDLGQVPEGIRSFLLAAIQFFVGWGVYGAMVKYPESGHPIGFRKAVPISLVTLLTYFVFAFVLMAIIAIGLSWR